MVALDPPVGVSELSTVGRGDGVEGQAILPDSGFTVCKMGLIIMNGEMTLKKINCCSLRLSLKEN